MFIPIPLHLHCGAFFSFLPVLLDLPCSFHFSLSALILPCYYIPAKNINTESDGIFLERHCTKIIINNEDINQGRHVERTFPLADYPP